MQITFNIDCWQFVLRSESGRDHEARYVWLEGIGTILRDKTSCQQSPFDGTEVKTALFTGKRCVDYVIFVIVANRMRFLNCLI